MSYAMTQDTHLTKKTSSIPSNLKAWFVWSFAGLFYLYQFVLRNSPGIMTEDLMRDLSVEACALGVLSAFYLVSYSSLQIPVGLAMDKFGPTRLLRLAILLCIMGTAIFAVSESFYLACFGRLLIGAGSTCAFLGSVKLGTLWFPPEKLALVVGFAMLSGKVGASLGQAPLALVVEALGWRQALLYVVIPVGLILALGIWFFVKDSPSGEFTASQAKVDTNIRTLFLQLKDIVSDYRVWALGFYGGFMYVPMLAFVDLWGVPFLMKLYGIDRATAGSVTTMYYFGVGIGSLTVAFLSDYFRARKAPMAIAAALSILCNAAIIYIPNVPLSVMYGLLFMAGVIFSAQPLIFSSVCQLTPRASNGTGASFINMLVMMLGLVLQPLVGWVIELGWGGVMQDGVPLYTISDYRIALLSIPLCLLLALLLMPFIPETFPREKKKGG